MQHAFKKLPINKSNHTNKKTHNTKKRRKQNSPEWPGRPVKRHRSCLGRNFCDREHPEQWNVSFLSRSRPVPPQPSSPSLVPQCWCPVPMTDTFTRKQQVFFLMHQKGMLLERLIKQNVMVKQTNKLIWRIVQKLLKKLLAEYLFRISFFYELRSVQWTRPF